MRHRALSEQSFVEPAYPAPLAPEAYHGIAGELIRAIGPHTEADLAALLATFLAAIGNLIGPGPHMLVGARRQGTNVYVVIVGRSAKSRKGTSESHIRAVVRLVDEIWEKTRVQSGLSSGEGLVHQVRDPVERAQKNGEGRYETVVVDAGVADKRLLVIESEFAQLMKVMRREGNTISTRVRDAWDGGVLQNMVRNNGEIATGAHISLIGHITLEELRAVLALTEAVNGFGNRILWFCAKRSKLLPFGGDVPEIEALVERLKQIAAQAASLGRLEWSPEAAAIWAPVYELLAQEAPGLYGAITARGETQTLRLMTLYAALDGSPTIQPEHLLAAVAVWEYCAASAWHLFGHSTGDSIADSIAEKLQQTPEGLSRHQIHHLFAGHVSSPRIARALSLLERTGRAQRAKRTDTGGRPAELWLPAAGGTAAPEESPLALARRLARELPGRTGDDRGESRADAAPVGLPLDGTPAAPAPRPPEPQPEPAQLAH